MNFTQRAIALAAIVSMPFATSCSSDSTASSSATIETATFASSLGVNLAGSTKTTNGVYTRDLVVGTGQLVNAGKSVTARYTGWLANGTQFDSNQTTGFQFVLDAGNVIRGWDEGIPGMRVGGKRQLVIPPALGYGARGNGAIPGNAILVFNVEIIAAQ